MLIRETIPSRPMAHARRTRASPWTLSGRGRSVLFLGTASEEMPDQAHGLVRVIGGAPPRSLRHTSRSPWSSGPV